MLPGPSGGVKTHLHPCVLGGTRRDTPARGRRCHHPGTTPVAVTTSSWGAGGAEPSCRSQRGARCLFCSCAICPNHINPPPIPQSQVAGKNLWFTQEGLWMQQNEQNWVYWVGLLMPGLGMAVETQRGEEKVGVNLLRGCCPPGRGGEAGGPGAVGTLPGPEPAGAPPPALRCQQDCPWGWARGGRWAWGGHTPHPVLFQLPGTSISSPHPRHPQTTTLRKDILGSLGARGPTLGLSGGSWGWGTRGFSLTPTTPVTSWPLSAQSRVPMKTPKPGANWGEIPPCAPTAASPHPQPHWAQPRDTRERPVPKSSTRSIALVLHPPPWPPV